MQGLILGIDLCDDYSQICCLNPLNMETEPITLSDEESSCLIPTLICKKKGEDTWFIGEEAYRSALFNEGTTVDKLLKLTCRGGSATIEDVKYTAVELLERFVRMMLVMAREKYQEEEIAGLTFTIQTIDPVLLEQLYLTAEKCGVSQERVHVMTHTESFVYYVVSQKPEYWANIACMFDLTEDGLHYYEMRMIRGRQPRIVEASHERLEESFSLDILDTPSGEHMGDSILAPCAERLLDRKVISSVFLTGKGFLKTSWASGFLQIVCWKHKVFAGQHMFAAGAAHVAFDRLQDNSAYPFVCVCEGRIAHSVTLLAQVDGRKERLVLAEAGTSWYEAGSVVELIPDDTDCLELGILPCGSPRGDKVTIDLSEFPTRPNKTTRIEVSISFVSEDCMTVSVTDLGFGELFPASGRTIRKEFYLS